MHSFIIVCLQKREREKKREEILKKYHIGSFDQIILDDQDNSIKSIRQAQKLLQYQTKEAKALIIKQLGKLSLPAQQALLKTIEEPPKKTIIVIEAENREEILPTIISRSQLIFISSRKTLDNKQQKEITSFWAKLLKNDSLNNRLQASTSISTKYADQEQLINWLNQQMIFFETLLNKRVGEKGKKQTLTPNNINQILKLLLFSKKCLQANINIKLTIDHLFLKLPQIEQY